MNARLRVWTFSQDAKLRWYSQRFSKFKKDVVFHTFTKMKQQYITSLYLKEDISSYTRKYPFTLDAVKNLKQIYFHKNVTFII